MPDWSKFGNPDEVLLTDPNVPSVFKVCVLQGVVTAHPDFSGDIGARIGAIFVIGIFLHLLLYFHYYHKSISGNYPYGFTCLPSILVQVLF